MRKFGFFIGVLLLAFACTQQGGKQVSSLNFLIDNSANVSFNGVLVSVDNADFIGQLDSLFGDAFVIEADGNSVPYERVTKGDKIVELLVLCDLKASSVNEFEIKATSQAPVFPKLTQAEIAVKEGGEWKMVTKKNGNQQWEYQGGSFVNVNEYRVPVEHTDHSFDIKYEGPGWESDKVGYRYYLDWRNAVDIFGKKINEPTLQVVGQDGFDSYHDAADWGQDVLKVGKSLGMGSLGYWDGEKAIRVEKTDSLFAKVAANGILRSVVKTNYYGWKIADKSVDVLSTISIDAGSRLSYQKVNMSTELDNMCTGIVKHGVELLVPDSMTGDWGYLATYGEQSLAKDNLGMVVFYRNADLVQQVEDKHSYVVVLKPTNNEVSYYFGAAWQQEKDGVTNIEDFKAYIASTLNLLNGSLNIKY